MSDHLDELEAMTDGVRSPFWDYFSKHVTREWGPGGIRYQQAVRDAVTKGPEAVVELQKILHTHEQILLLMQWPHERVQALKRQGLREVSAGRRGGL